jgi:Flp pilus assembly protein TadG
MQAQAPRATCVALLRSRRGATAVEFAIVAPAVLLLIFAVIELGLAFTMSVNLANATSVAARQLRVGEVTAPGVAATSSTGTSLDLADFKTAVCNNIPLVALSTCQQNLQIDVRTVNSFTGQTPPSPVSGTTFSTTGLCYYSGASGSIVEVTGYYLWPVFTPVILGSLVNVTTLTTSNGSTSGSWMLLTATEVFKNEPDPNISNNASGC